MKRMLLVGVLLCATAASFGQTREPQLKRSVLYLELLGNAVGVSVNYEYLFFNNLSARFGFGVHHCFCDESVVYSPPADSGDFWYGGYEPSPSTTAVFILMANFLTQTSSSHLELGGGLMYMTAPAAFLDGNKNTHIFPTMSMAYRYQPWSGGIVFRFGVMPVFKPDEMIVSFGIGMGGAF